MRKKICAGIGGIVFGTALVISAAWCRQGEWKPKDMGGKTVVETEVCRDAKSSDNVSAILLASKKKSSNGLVGKVATPLTNKELSQKEAYVNWQWSGVAKKDGVMKGIRTWINGNGKEKTKKITVKSSCVVGHGIWGEGKPGEIVPVAKMHETKKGKLYFLCNTYEEWKYNYLAASSSGKELRGGKLDLTELVTGEDGACNGYFRFTNMEVSGNTIIIGYDSRKSFEDLDNSKCGILFINTKTGKWTNKELGTKWRGMELSGDAAYVLDGKSVFIMKYDTGEETVISMPDIEAPEPAYEEASVNVGAVTYRDNRVYLLDVHGNLYACDLNGSGTFELLSANEFYSYPAYTLQIIQASSDGKNLYAAFWEGDDECYPEDYKAYHWVKYNIK